MMKLIVLAAVVSVAFGAYSGDPRLAKVLSSDSDISPDGGYHFNYETENGISAQASGAPKSLGGTDPPAVVVQGSYQWDSPEGGPIRIDYVADENGYQPSGNILPTPPPTQPIPPAILRALEYIAAHPPAPETRRR